MELYHTETGEIVETTERGQIAFLGLLFAEDNPANTQAILIECIETENMQFPDNAILCSNLRLLRPLNAILENYCLDLPVVRQLMGVRHLTAQQAILLLRTSRGNWIN